MISVGEVYEAKKKEFEIVEKYYQTGIRMSRSPEYGRCNKCRDGQKMQERI